MVLALAASHCQVYSYCYAIEQQSPTFLGLVLWKTLSPGTGEWVGFWMIQVHSQQLEKLCYWAHNIQQLIVT